MKTLLNEHQLQAGVDAMAAQISERYGNRQLTIVAVMTGSLVLMADLMRRLTMPVRVSLIQASSYRGGVQSGELWIRDDMMLDVKDREVMVIDDIFDTGKTMQEVLRRIDLMGPQSLASAVLLGKLPFRDPERLLMVWDDASAIGFPRNDLTPASYEVLRTQNQVFEELAAACPKGIDAYFENVGGAVFEAVLPLLKSTARMTICGLISHYGDAPGVNAGEAIAARARARGVIVKNLFVGDYVETHHDQMLAEVAPAVARGDIRYLEDIREGLETLPTAFAEMLKGGNFGKMLVRVADDPTL